jgi:hypothetical protein
VVVVVVEDEEHHIRKCSCSYMNRSDSHFEKDLMEAAAVVVVVVLA